MNCWPTCSVLAIAYVLSCQPCMSAQVSVPAGNAQLQTATACSASSFREHPFGPEVTVAELTFDGNLRMPVSGQDEIATSIKQETYWGKPDAAASEVEERVRQAWQNRDYCKVQARSDAHLLASNPTNKQLAVTVHIDEGQQYRLEEIRFRNNSAISNVDALRNLFPNQEW
jgi:outer membrane protein assembly factor BamA